MPLIRRREDYEHHFAWSLVLEEGQTVQLMPRPDTLAPPPACLAPGPGVRDQFRYFELAMAVRQVYVSRPDVVLELEWDRSMDPRRTFVGPWCVTGDAPDRRRAALIVPVRLGFGASVRALSPGRLGAFVCAPVQVGIRATFFRDVP